MRLLVTTPNGIKYGDRTYGQGEELVIEDTTRGRQWAVAFIAKKLAKRADPVVVGAPPAPPKAPPRQEQPQPPSTKISPITAADAPGPVQNLKSESWMQPTWEAKAAEPEDDEAPPSDPTSEETAEGQTARRRGRYARRDLKSEE